MSHRALAGGGGAPGTIHVAQACPRMFAALVENAEYRRFYAGQAISLLGTWSQAAAVSWIVFELTRSALWLGAVEACGIVPSLLVGLSAGATADRVRPRSMILTMQASQMLLAWLLAALVGLGIARVWQMALIVALGRVCVTFELPSRQVMLKEVVGRSWFPNAIALNSGLFHAAKVLGPALAGLCLARFGRSVPFALNGLSYLASIAAVLSIRVGCCPVAQKGCGEAGILGGIAYLRRDGQVRTLYLLITAVGIAGTGYVALVPAYARLVVHTGPLGYSLLLACGGLGATAGALVVAAFADRHSRESLVHGGATLLAVSLLAAATLPAAIGGAWSPRVALPVAASCLLGAGLGASVFYASAQTLIQSAVPDELRGRIMGLWMIAYSGPVALGALWAGCAAQRWGVAPALGASALLCASAALVMYLGGTLHAQGPAGTAADCVKPVR